MFRNKKIRELKERYGNIINYRKLSRSQRNFLLHPEIKDYKDEFNNKTVKIKGFSKLERKLLLIEDNYKFYKKTTNEYKYNLEREDMYEKVIGIKKYSSIIKKPVIISNTETKYFFLDNSKIQVKFDAYRKKP